jgi:hypothetical protein
VDRGEGSGWRRRKWKGEKEMDRGEVRGIRKKEVDRGEGNG